MKQRVEIAVRGLVQGVGYRAFVKRIAERLDVTGFAENMPDGSVKIIAEGERPKLEELIQECKRGPMLSEVESVDEKWHPYKGEFNDFTYF